MHDVIVIGGSYAGMAAALQLVRARRSIHIVDAGQRRNRFAAHSHGFLGQDGVDPAEIWATARRQLEAYPTLRWTEGRVVAASGDKDHFEVTLGNGDVLSGRRLLFATGVADQLPPVPGMAERWGRSVFHCPYCHGYELHQGRIAVIATGPNSIHQAQLLPEWGQVTFFTNGSITLDDDARQSLAERSVQIEETRIDRLDGEADIVLTDGRVLSFVGMFTAPACAPASKVPEAMGCELMETPMGIQIRTNDAKQTSLPGVYACGDVARAPHSVSLAVGDGAWAGAQLHRSLVWPDS
ncbi:MULTISPECIES: NAD(P)/FAD-dependent oxidoreductase [Dyella]|uniref:NAD(P)/FAD-dependent oxidoreductase n=2 Tax=Dyella TaxID=231454 RepID=A0A4R0YDV4_9GAMM|nr:MULTISPECIES: NAD(P)/FAD-dependent oxidoreductase [Dyella]TBR36094.1 NAD(P)/FAD-dependent oxidoreductase [Dyella terrae]TCI06143.1 NAD(P)/FAD-dependent oxidoreductase [Dyella soli]